MAKNKKGTSLVLPYGKQLSRLFYLPLVVLLCVLPLIVRVVELPTYLEDEAFFDTRETYYDFFLHYKSVFLIIISSIMAVIVAVRLLRDRKSVRTARIFLPLAGYAALVLLSSLFSDHMKIAFIGGFEQSQPVWVHFGYCMIAYYTFLLVSDVKGVRTVVAAIAASCVIIELIGVLQVFDRDFFETTLGLRLILTDDLFEFRENISTAFNTVYSTLYNPNYVGSYGALLLPVFVTSFFAAKNIASRIFFGILSGGLFVCILGSASRGGWIGLFLGFAVLMFILLHGSLKNIIPISCVLVCLTVLAVFVNSETGILFSRITDTIASAKDTNSPARIEGIETRTNDVPMTIADIETRTDDVLMTIDGSILSIAFRPYGDDGSWSFFFADSDGKTLQAYSSDGYHIKIDDARFANASFYLLTIDEGEGLYGFTVEVGEDIRHFYNTGESYYLITSYGKLLKARNSSSIGFLERRGSMMSGRFFIWSHTIPLLPDYIILGAGADNFIYAFPNDDGLALERYGFDGQVITKPHNLYLQVAVESGMLSLICLLAFYVMYFVPGLILFIRNRRLVLEPLGMLGAGILTGTFAYMFTGLVNDSCVTVAPIFWTLMGCGIAVNMSLASAVKATSSPAPARKGKR